eukprot:GFKZ01001248.1.p1 GENE.GFKZ01001248.1~~GFKZ01001248.1.p1  ORF type:complete len:494 (+),score=62.70 GFKZ01001248.1:245-1726(+)
MTIAPDLCIEPIHPFGALVRNFNVTVPEHQSRLPSLLYKNRILLLPANCHAKNSPPLNTVESLSTIGALFGTIETEHPVNPLVRNSPVQRISTTRSTADSYVFHSDMTWNTSPSLVCLLCMVDKPRKGGDTCFRSSIDMFEALSQDSKEALCRSSFENSLTKSYGLMNREFLIQKERVGVHPGVIRHPATGEPCFYVNKNATTRAVGLSSDDSSNILERAYSQAEAVEVYRHKWTAGDILIWDNMAVQHRAVNDYNETRVVYRASAGEKWFRPERCVLGRSVEEATRDIRIRMNSIDSFAYGAEEAMVFEHDMRNCGYRLPEVVATEVMKRLEIKKDLAEKLKIMDIAAGTGLVGLAFMRKDSEDLIMDAVDRSAAMAKEAKRRKIYEEYFVRDMNDERIMLGTDGAYDAIVCVDGIGRNDIQVDKGLQKMVRMARRGGLIVFTATEGVKEDVNCKLEMLVKEECVDVLDDYIVSGFSLLPKNEFRVVALKVV